jgi:hypothetical protein
LVSASVNVAAVSAIVFGFVIVNVIVDVPFAAIVAGENAFAIVAVAVVTVAQDGVTPLARLASEEIFDVLLVNAAGLVAQLALT